MFQILDQPFKIASAVDFFITAIILSYSAFVVLRQFLKKHKNTTFFLLLLLGSCALITMLSGMDAIFYKQPGGYDRFYGYAYSLIFMAFACIGLVYLATEVFSEENVSNTSRIGRFIFSMGFLILSIIGMYNLLIEQALVQSSIPLILMFLLNFGFLVFMGIRAYSLAHRVENPHYKTSIQYIGHYSLCNILLYVAFISDSFVAASPDQIGSTYWGFIGTIIFLIISLLAYMGFVKPMRSAS